MSSVTSIARLLHRPEVVEEINAEMQQWHAATPLQLDCRRQSQDDVVVARMLLDAGAGVNQTSSSPLLDACYCGSTALVTLLLERGAHLKALPSGRDSLLVCLPEWRAWTCYPAVAGVCVRRDSFNAKSWNRLCYIVVKWYARSSPCCCQPALPWSRRGYRTGFARIFWAPCRNALRLDCNLAEPLLQPHWTTELLRGLVAQWRTTGA